MPVKWPRLSNPSLHKGHDTIYLTELWEGLDKIRKLVQVPDI